LSDLLLAVTPEDGQVPALAVRNGLHFDEPEWLPDLISRYGLTSPR